MALISNLIFIATCIVFFFGQLLRLDFKGISFPLIDIFIFLLFCLNILNHLQTPKIKIKNIWFLLFIVFAWITTVFNIYHYSFDPIKPIFYLTRLTLLISFFIFPIQNTFIHPKIKPFFNLIIIANILFGLIQYFFWPNFTYFNSLNWDPHLYRLVSTFFDPTFTGLIFLFFLIKIFLKPKFPHRLILLLMTYLGMALTYSRSTFLSFIFAFSFISFKKKKPKIFIISLLLVVLTIFILPRQQGEGTKLERTSSIKAKIENYKEGFGVFLKSPIIGSGYNNLFYVRQIKIKESHANSGFDSSLLTILTTTGLIGFIFFVLGSVKLFNQSNLIEKSFLIALFIHSLFANSILYPWTIIFLIFGAL